MTRKNGEKQGKGQKNISIQELIPGSIQPYSSRQILETDLRQTMHLSLIHILMATIMCPDHRPQLGTVRPGVFKKSEPGEVKDIPVIKEKVEITDAEKRVELLEVINEMAGELVDLENAEIIVSGGRGVGGPEGFAPVRELAEVLGATVGASRAAVDAGWIPHAHQVGQTGKTVGPKIYIACLLYTSRCV